MMDCLPPSASLLRAQVRKGLVLKSSLHWPSVLQPHTCHTQLLKRGPEKQVLAKLTGMGTKRAQEGPRQWLA